MAQNEAKHSVDLTVKVQEFEQRLKNAEGMLEKSVTRMSSKPVSLKMDDSHVNQYYKNLEAKQKEFAVKQQLAEAALVKQRRISTMQSVQLAAQVQDFGIQVAGGQNPLLAAVQQGSQLHFIYGGLGNALRALGSLITPVRVGLLGLGVAAYSAYKVFANNQEQLEKYNKALQLTGNYAETSASELESLVQAQSRVSSFKSSSIRDAVTGLAGSGQFNLNEIKQMSEVVLNFARISGKTEQEVVQHFSRMKTAPADFAREMLLVNGRLTADEVLRIRKLEESGQKIKAGYELQKLVVREFGEGTKKELSAMDSVLSKAGKAWDEFWARVRGSYVETNEERMSRLKRNLEEAKRGLPIARQGQSESPGVKRATEALEQESYRQEREKLKNGQVERERLELEAKLNREASASAVAALESQRRELQLANELSGIKYEISLYEKDIANTADEYQKAILEGNKNELERKAILLEINKLNEDYARAADGSKSDPASRLAAEQKRLAIYTQIIQKWQSLFGMKDSASLFSVVGSKDAEKARQDRLKELEKYNKDAEELAIQLSEKQKEIEAGYLTDVTEKAKRELEIEAAKYRKKIELAEEGSEARKKAEGAYYDWLAANEAKILDDYQKRTNIMRGISDGVKEYFAEMEDKGEKAKEMTKQTLQSIEDGMVSLLTTGKMDVKSFINTLIAEFYRLRIIKPLMAEIFGGMGGGSGGGGWIGRLMQIMLPGGGYGGGSSIYSLSGSSGGGGVWTGGGLKGSWSTGGYTGVGGTTEPAGIVHKGEFVLQKSAVDQIGLGKLMAMNNGGGAGNGAVINVSIDSSTDRAQVTRLVQQGVQAGLSMYHNQVQRGLV